MVASHHLVVLMLVHHVLLARLMRTQTRLLARSALQTPINQQQPQHSARNVKLVSILSLAQRCVWLARHRKQRSTAVTRLFHRYSL